MPFVRHPAWVKATPIQIDLYQSLVAETRPQIVIPSEVVACTDHHCYMHYQQLDNLCL